MVENSKRSFLFYFPGCFRVLILIFLVNTCVAQEKQTIDSLKLQSTMMYFKTLKAFADSSKWKAKAKDSLLRNIDYLIQYTKFLQNTDQINLLYDYAKGLAKVTSLKDSSDKYTLLSNIHDDISLKLSMKRYYPGGSGIVGIEPSSSFLFAKGTVCFFITLPRSVSDTSRLRLYWNSNANLTPAQIFTGKHIECYSDSIFTVKDKFQCVETFIPGGYSVWIKNVMTGEIYRADLDKIAIERKNLRIGLDFRPVN